MKLPPVIIVHGLRDIKLVQATGCAHSLLSAPGAALFGGCLWWRALLDEAGHTGPAFLDSAAAPGRAWEGLKLGLPGIILAPCAVWDQVAAYAAAQGAMLLATAPVALDLASPGAARRLNGWLTSGGNG